MAVIFARAGEGSFPAQRGLILFEIAARRRRSRLADKEGDVGRGTPRHFAGRGSSIASGLKQILGRQRALSRNARSETMFALYKSGQAREQFVLPSPTPPCRKRLRRRFILCRHREEFNYVRVQRVR